MDDAAVHLRYPPPAIYASVDMSMGANENGPKSVANGDPAIEALREAKARRSAQSRRRHARMDRELEELCYSEE